MGFEQDRIVINLVINGKAFTATINHGKLTVLVDPASGNVKNIGESVLEHVLSWQNGDCRKYGELVRHIDRLETCV